MPGKMEMRPLSRGVIRTQYTACLEAKYLNYYPSEVVSVRLPQYPKIPLEVRYCPALAEKHKTDHQTLPNDGTSSKPNPFLPFDRRLFLGDLHPSREYALLFNKFCVIPEHLLVITKEYVKQEAPLHGADFEAVGEVLLAYDGEREPPSSLLAFYNSSPVAGASQHHRHFQVVELSSLPIEAAIDGCEIEPGKPFILPIYASFLHLCVKMDLAKHTAWDYYQLLTNAIKPGLLQAFNLLWNRHWMLLVPRRRDHPDKSMNSLVFAGLFLVLERASLQTYDPLGSLQSVTYPAGGP